MTKNTNLTDINEPTTVVPKKRGRKSKKEIELAKEKSLNEQLMLSSIEQNNINVLIEDTYVELNNIDSLLNSDDLTDSIDNEIITNTNFLLNDSSSIIEDSKPLPKKRGRKPKGGKIIQQIVPLNNNKETKPNVILHLKCSLKDLHLNKLSYNSDIQSFEFSNTNHLTYDIIKSENTTFNKSEVLNNQNDKYSDDDNDYDDNSTKENDIRDIWKKLKNLEHNLHINSICDKKSACFWCTCDFDNPPVYIPKHFIKESYHVYGCFCSPECATAYLMEENIDSSAKFERYHLINNIYAKIYDYKKNIKPAPNPYYMLDKYYGNLSIQEYRSLLKNERLFLVVDKPLTRILPELHQDNDDFIINNKIIPSNTFQMKKKLIQKKKTKSNILNEQFGLNQQ